LRTILTGDCQPDNIFRLVDPTQFVEIDFEAEVVKALTCLLPEYLCGVFAGNFVHEGERRSADLALIHKSLSHWFVVEVELAGHSLHQHVLPQVRCFRYGEPEQSCVTSLCRAFGELSRGQAESVLKFVPRYVAVVSNIFDALWLNALTAIDAQLLTVSIYRDRNGRSAHEMEGRLSVPRESLGFGRFSAVDNSLRLPRSCGLSLGLLQVQDQFGNVGPWSVRESGDVLWITKDQGPALIEHESYVQVIRTFDGLVSIRPSS
jgi:hypothetical protein